MYDAVTGVQIPDNHGCIMADEMVRYNLVTYVEQHLVII